MPQPRKGAPRKSSVTKRATPSKTKRTAKSSASRDRPAASRSSLSAATGSRSTKARAKPAHKSKHSSQREFLALEPEFRQHVVVLPDAELEEVQTNTQPLTDKWKRLAKTAMGAGSGGGAAAAAAQLAARAAAAPVAGLLVAGGAAGLAVALLVDRGRAMPAGVAFIDARTAEAVGTPGGPLKVRVLYDVHPARRDLYVPDNEYKRFLLEARAREAERFFLHCGASRVELRVERGEDITFGGNVGLSDGRFGLKSRFKARRKTSSGRATVIEAPGFPEPEPFDDKQWLWANVESDWWDVREKRIASRISRHQIITEVEDQRQLSGDAKARLAKIASVEVAGQKESVESTKWVWDVRFPQDQ